MNEACDPREPGALVYGNDSRFFGPQNRIYS